MPEVDIKVAGRTYRVGCGVGEEDRLAELAARIDREAQVLSKQMGAISEGRLMLMTSLMLADKLSDTETALGDAETRASQAKKASSATPAPAEVQVIDAEREAQIAANLDNLSARIETLVGRMQGAA